VKVNLKDIKFWLETVWIATTSIFQKTYIANICGHRTKRQGVAVSFGERGIMNMPLEENGQPGHCLECIGKMAIRCGWCGKPINIGDMVTPYVPKPEMPEYTRYHQDGPNDTRTVIGCCRSTCREFPGDEHGQWLPPGKVERSPSVIERLSGAVEDGDECPVIMVKA
jgi:hypothetical protein